jgi:hypothetical protein
MGALSVSSAWSERCQELAEPIGAACAAASVTAGPAALAKEIGKRAPDSSFREILCRGGWYRLGGLVSAAGERVSDNLEAWATEQLEQRYGDLAVLREDFADSGLRATQWIGRTHYLVATTGGGSTDFLQVEVEDLQETLAHRLFERESNPTTLDELVDPRAAGRDKVFGTPIAAGRYAFRRLTHVGDLLARMRTQSLEPQPIHRFVADWDASSAGSASAFCNHWALALREHLDRYRQTQVRATPIAALGGELPRLAVREGTSGLALHNALQAFDRQVGYPFAWFFSLLTSKVPHWLAAAVASDAASGFSYLPERDLAIVKQWLHRPYAF